MSSVQRAREARTGEDPIIGGPDRFSDQMKIQNPLIRRVRCWLFVVHGVCLLYGGGELDRAIQLNPDSKLTILT